MDEGLLSLKWNNHKPAFANLLKVLRKKGCYTDVTLACGSKFFEVHRLVLMACSEFFTNVFDRITCQKPVIVLNEVKSQELEALLDYMYLGEVDVQQKHLPGLIKAAEYLLIKGLAIPDEDPPQNPKPNKIDDEEERPSKRRRQERDSRESERHSRESERVNPNVHIDQQQYSKSGSSDAHKGTSSVNRIPVHQIDEDNEYEVESDNIQPSRVQPDAFSSLNRTHQQDTLHRVENRQNTDSETVSDIKTQDRVDSYSEPDIKTEVCDISEIEEIDSSGVKTELDIRNDNASENSSDFSHFLSSNVEQNLASHMFHSPHQAPGPSGIQRLAGCEVGGGEGIGDEGRSDLFPSHLMGDGLTDGGAPGAQMGCYWDTVQCGARRKRTPGGNNTYHPTTRANIVKDAKAFGSATRAAAKWSGILGRTISESTVRNWVIKYDDKVRNSSDETIDEIPDEKRGRPTRNQDPLETYSSSR